MPYVPQDPPSAAELDSLEFKEWLTTVQQFYLNEAGFLSLDTVPVSGEYYLKLSDTYIYFDTINPSGTYLYLPKATEVLGKKYYIFTKPGYPNASASVIMRVAKYPNIATGEGSWVDRPISIVKNGKYEFVATEQGWVVNEL